METYNIIVILHLCILLNTLSKCWWFIILCGCFFCYRLPRLRDLLVNFENPLTFKLFFPHHSQCLLHHRLSFTFYGLRLCDHRRFFLSQTVCGVSPLVNFFSLILGERSLQSDYSLSRLRGSMRVDNVYTSQHSEHIAKQRSFILDHKY